MLLLKNLFNIPMNVYKMIFNNSAKPELSTESNDFLAHYAKYQVVLRDIVQTESQKNNFFIQVVDKVSTNRSELINSELLNYITLPNNEISTEVTALAFNEKASLLVKNLNVDNYDVKKTIFKNDISILSTDTHRHLFNSSKALAQGFLKENPYYLDAVKTLARVGANNTEILATLLQYSHYCEVITHISCSSILAICFGYKIYVYTYYSLNKIGAFTQFLEDVNKTMRISDKSFFIKTKIVCANITDIVYTNRFSILISCSSILIGGILNHQYSLPIKNILHPYLPGPETLLRTYFEYFRDSVGVVGYSLGAIMGTFRRSLYFGFFGENFQESLNKIVNTLKIKTPSIEIKK